jgi:hypothetical protein
MVIAAPRTSLGSGGKAAETAPLYEPVGAAEAEPLPAPFRGDSATTRSVKGSGAPFQVGRMTADTGTL